MTPDTIMIFAAGLGTRMGALTRSCPKPLLPVLGRPLIDHALALADRAGIGRKVVNTHYLGHMLADHLRPRQDVFLIDEPDPPLETGGGLKNAVSLLGAGPVFTLNPDTVWAGDNPLIRLAANWNATEMEAILMLVPLPGAAGHRGSGDFVITHDGHLTRYTGTGVPYVFGGAQIVDPACLAEITDRRFSLNLVWDRMISRNRLFGCVHSGGWVDVGTPAGLALAETIAADAADV